MRWFWWWYWSWSSDFDRKKGLFPMLVSAQWVSAGEHKILDVWKVFYLGRFKIDQDILWVFHRAWTWASSMPCLSVYLDSRKVLISIASIQAGVCPEHALSLQTVSCMTWQFPWERRWQGARIIFHQLPTLEHRGATLQFVPKFTFYLDRAKISQN